MVDLSYDDALPLHADVEVLGERDGVVVARCRYDNAEGSPVEGFLAFPSGALLAGDEVAGVIYQHSTGGKEGFLPEAIQVAEAGGIALSLAIADTGDSVRNLRESILAIRRGADLLTSYGVDRLGCVGHSMGAMMAGTVSGIDRRFRCFVFDSGLSGMSIFYRDTAHPETKRVRESMTPEEYEPLLALMEPYDCGNFVGDAAPAALLFQSAWFDPNVSRAHCEAFFAAGSEPKEFRWYDTGHVINEVAAYSDRARFLAQWLDLPGLPDRLRSRT
ncbi:alpha/beta hydrolase family protein [Kribbella sp. NPDC056951]|uniref:alpha/beta hydrolase family protein n=1 Tax=Kribbella sp. NPDC056951 TaxID=3345978 RepID=UPI00363C9E27